MEDSFFYNSDGDFLIVPQLNSLVIATEFGVIEAAPGEIVVLPRGIKFQVKLPQPEARGYVLENYGPPFRLPGLGPIGANGLANPRDFLAPTAAYTKREGRFTLINKFCGNLFEAQLNTHLWMWWAGTATISLTNTTWPCSM